MELSVHVQAKAVGSAAHLTALRREAVGKHNVRDAWQLDELIQQVKDKREQAATADQAAVANQAPITTDQTATGKLTSDQRIDEVVTV